MSTLPPLSRPVASLGMAGLLAAACSSGQSATSRGSEPLEDAAVEADAPGDEPAAPPRITIPDAAFDAGSYESDILVYAHSGSDLFRVDPNTLTLSRVGPLAIPEPGGRLQYLNTVADIAVDRRGRILGVTYDSLLEINSETAECKFIAALPSDLTFNGLSFLRADQGQEQLVATTLEGTIHRIDPETGAVRLLGSFGAGLQSSGDLVSVASYGTLATVKGEDTDLLARMDPVNGAASLIGPIGFTHVWGMGFWKDKVFGFTNRGEFLLIDPRTGTGIEVEQDSSAPFWGAGVTTSVPVVVVR